MYFLLELLQSQQMDVRLVQIWLQFVCQQCFNTAALMVFNEVKSLVQLLLFD